MKKIKLTISWLFLMSWLFTSGFQPLPQSVSFDRSHSLFSLSQPAAPADFGKISPMNGNISQPTIGVKLQWNLSSGTGLTYQYCLRANLKQFCPGPKWVSVGSATSVTLDTLSANTLYYWQVRAKDQSNTITYADSGAWWSFKTTSGAPAAFGKVGPAISAINQPLSLVLSWGASGTNVSYEYCYSITNNCSASGTWYQVTTATSATISGLNYRTTYYWQVRAKNVGGTTYTYSDGGLAWSFSTLDAPPAPFVKLSPLSTASSEPLNPVLQWSSSTGATGYSYCINTNLTNSGNCINGISTGMTTSVTLPTLAYNTTYYWQVSAANSTETISANAGVWWSFKTLENVPASFTKINPLNVAAKQSLTPWLYWWTPTTPGNTYEYCLSTTDSVCPTSWLPVAENSPIHITNALANYQTYYWQVRATQGGATTYANNAWWSFTTLKSGPSSSDQPFSCAEDATLNAQLSASSNYASIFSLVGGLPAGTLNFNSDGSFAYTPAANFNGQVNFQFVVTDGYNPPTAPYTVTVTVTPVNDAPVLAPIPDQVVSAGDLIIFIADATDPDLPYGDSLIFSVVEALPSGAAINAQTGVFSWITSVAMTPGIYTFTIKVTDSGTTPLLDTQQVKITVTPFVPASYGFYLPRVSR